MPLQKWFLAVMLMLNAKKGLSALQLSRDLSVNKNTAWRITMQIRKAMTQAAQRNLLTGIVEMDETYVGRQAAQGHQRRWRWRQAQDWTRHQEGPSDWRGRAWRQCHGKGRC